MTEEEVADAIRAFADGAAAAKAIGFDAIELHGAARLPDRPVSSGTAPRRARTPTLEEISGRARFARHPARRAQAVGRLSGDHPNQQ
jgi:hypothetical protein